VYIGLDICLEKQNKIEPIKVVMTSGDSVSKLKMKVQQEIIQADREVILEAHNEKYDKCEILDDKATVDEIKNDECLWMKQSM